MFRRRRGRWRLFFATDLHGSDRCFRKWLNAAEAYDASVLVLGGDVSGKLLVPVIEGQDGTLRANLNGRMLTASTEEELASVTAGLAAAGHYSVRIAEHRWTASTVSERERMMTMAVEERLCSWLELAEERLVGGRARAIMMLGNDDAPDLARHIESARCVEYGESAIREIPAGLEVLSFGATPPTPWDTPREVEENELAAELERRLACVSDPARLILNLHAPPYGTPLDQAPRLDRDMAPRAGAGGVATAPVGARAVRDLIEREQPLLGLHGHVHEARAAHRIGRTICINPGSEYGDGVLAGALITFEDDGRLAAWQLVRD
jgi:Icc-related predicted phosphoesterase